MIILFSDEAVILAQRACQGSVLLIYYISTVTWHALHFQILYLPHVARAENAATTLRALSIRRGRRPRAALHYF